MHPWTNRVHCSSHLHSSVSIFRTSVSTFAFQIGFEGETMGRLARWLVGLNPVRSGSWVIYHLYITSLSCPWGQQKYSKMCSAVSSEMVVTPPPGAEYYQIHLSCLHLRYTSSCFQFYRENMQKLRTFQPGNVFSSPPGNMNLTIFLDFYIMRGQMNYIITILLWKNW